MPKRKGNRKNTRDETRKRRKVLLLSNNFSVDKDDYSVLKKILSGGVGAKVVTKQAQKIVTMQTMNTGRRIHYLDLSKSSIPQLGDVRKEIGNLGNLRVLNLRTSSITCLPAEIGNLINLRVMDLSASRIEMLPDSIGRLKNLQELNLSRCRFMLGLPATIGNLASLNKLDLRDTSVRSLPASIGKLRNLRCLDLVESYNVELPYEISNLPSLNKLGLPGSYNLFLHQFQGLQNLKELNFENAKLSKLPRGTKKLVSLTKLNLRKASIDLLSSTIGSLQNLKELDLSHTMRLLKLPNEIRNLTRLTTLNLGRSFIKKLPFCVGELQSLEELDLSETILLQGLPEGIGNLKSLEILNLHGSSLQELPESIGNLASLEILDLHESSIKKLPSCVGELQSLKWLNLSGMRLQGLPEGIGNLAGLERLSVGHLNIKCLPSSIWQLQKLCDLDLSGRYHNISAQLWNFTNLVSLNLHWAAISSLPESIGNFTNLKFLDLYGTSITSLPNSIRSMTNLMYLDIENTKIPALRAHQGSRMEFLLQLADDCKSLGSLNRMGSGIEKLGFALACNRARFRMKDVALNIWPLVLHSASSAFDRYPPPSGYLYYSFYMESRTFYSMRTLDALYQILAQVREPFIWLLIDRNRKE